MIMINKDGIKNEEDKTKEHAKEYVTTQSGRTVKPPTRTKMNQVNIPRDHAIEEEYMLENGCVIVGICRLD